MRLLQRVCMRTCETRGCAQGAVVCSTVTAQVKYVNARANVWMRAECCGVFNSTAQAKYVNARSNVWLRARITQEYRYTDQDMIVWFLEGFLGFLLLFVFLSC